LEKRFRRMIRSISGILLAPLLDVRDTLCAGYAWVDAVHDGGYVRDLVPDEHLKKRRDVRQRRGPYPHPFKVDRPVTHCVVEALASRLLDADHRDTVGELGVLLKDWSLGHLLQRSLDEVYRLVDLVEPYECSPIDVLGVVGYGLKV